MQNFQHFLIVVILISMTCHLAEITHSFCQKKKKKKTMLSLAVLTVTRTQLFLLLLRRLFSRHLLHP